MIVKVLGIIDIVAAVLILFNVNAGINFVIFLALLAKGLMSMMADGVGKVYGAFDIAAAFMIVYAINPGAGIAMILFFFFIYKGLVSLV